MKLKIDWKFIRSSAIIGFSNIMARALGILFSFGVAKLYAPAQFGEFRYLMALSAVLIIPTQALPRTLSRFVTKYRTIGQEEADRYFSNSLLLVSASTLVVTAITVAVGLILHKLGVGLVALCVGLSLFAIYYDLLRAMERFYAIAVFYISANVLQLVTVLSAALAHVYSITLVAAAYGLSCVPPFLAIELSRRSPIRFRAGSISWPILRELMGFSLPMLLAHTAYTAWYAGDLLLVEHILGYTAAGNYALSKTITMVFIFVPYAATTVALPLFVHAESRNGATYLRATLLTSAVTSLALLAFLVIGGNFMLHAVFHQKYATAGLTLLPVAIGMAMYSLYLVLETWVVSVGRPLLHAYGMTAMAGTTLIADVLLIPAQRQVGAGIGFVLGAGAGLLTIATGAWLTRPGREQVRQRDLLPGISLTARAAVVASEE